MALDPAIKNLRKHLRVRDKRGPRIPFDRMEFELRDVPEGASFDEMPRNGYGRIQSCPRYISNRAPTDLDERYLTFIWGRMRHFMASGYYAGKKHGKMDRWWVRFDGHDPTWGD